MISNLLQLFHQAGSADDCRSGKPRVTTQRPDRCMILRHLQGKFQPTIMTSITTIGTQQPPVSGNTPRRFLRRHLRGTGLTARWPSCGPTLSNQIWDNRMVWAEAHPRWTFQLWRTVLFNDETFPSVLWDLSDSRQAHLF